MTSPTPAQPPHFSNQPFNLAQPPPYRRAPSTLGPGAVQTPSTASQSPSAQQHNAPNEGNDAIRDGKQRAKDIMAASGIDVRSTPQQNASPETTSSVDASVNGIPMSRKRSRSGSRIPARASTTTTTVPSDSDPSSHEQTLLRIYMERDDVYLGTVIEQSQRSGRVVAEKRDLKELYESKMQDRNQNPEKYFGHGYNGFGNGHTDRRPAALIYPSMRRRAGNRRTRELKFTRKDTSMQAECLEELVPVRLDIELEKLRLRDTFTWNLNDRLVPPQAFAEALVEDLRLPIESSHHLVRQVQNEIVDQLNNYYPAIWPSGTPAEPLLPYWAHKNDDMRIMVRLNITIGHITLQDQFEWDINDPANSPEEFARQMALDLSLSGEFTTAIAHSIREQSQMYTRSLFLVNYEFDGRPIEDPDIRDNLLPSPVFSAFRPHQIQKDWTPYLYEINEADLEKTELSMLREQRAQKRQLNRRGGPALPDLRERPRTVRSLIISEVIPGAAETMEATGILKVRRTTGRGRRARLDDASDSDDLELEDSGPDSPAPSAVNPGTARTRGMRGAASAAQVAMRNTYGRSQTPDIVQETRSSARRSGAHELREESPDQPTSFIVKLRIAPAKLKQVAQRQKFGRSGAPPLSGFPTSQTVVSKAATPQPTPTPKARAPATPSMAKQVLPNSTGNATPLSQVQQSDDTDAMDTTAPSQVETQYTSQGRVDAAHSPLPNEPTPPPPAWLDAALTTLRARHPTSSFTALMRFSAVDALSDSPVRLEHMASIPPGSPPPPAPAKDADGRLIGSGKLKWQWLPRIRCNDCPGKVYTALPTDTAGQFEVHLKNRKHKELVEARIRREEQEDVEDGEVEEGMEERGADED